MVQIILNIQENIEEEEEEEEEELINCPICFIEDTNNFILLNCKHPICTHCFQTWHINNNKNECCICRKEIFPTINIKNVYFDKYSIIILFYISFSIMVCIFFYIIIIG